MEKFDAELQDRLVRYASIDTQSQETSHSTPSTVIQYDLLNLLKQELQDFGASDVQLTDYGTVLGCCQTNEPNHQYSFDEYVYEVTKERHSVRAASRFSLNVLRFESDLCELNKL